MKEGWGDWREGERWEMAILIKWKCIFFPCYWFGPVVLYFSPIESCSEVVEANQEKQQPLAAISDAGARNHSHLSSSSTVQLLVFLLHSSSSVSSLFLSALRLTVLQSATCSRQCCLTLFFQYMRPAFCLALFPLLKVTFHLQYIP